MRILQVITDTDRRGAQVFALELGEGLRALGHEVATVALAPGAVGGLDVPVLARSRRTPGLILRLRRRMAGADVTVAHGSSTGPACALAGHPFVYRQISDSRFWAPTRRRRARVRRVLGRARLVVALSETNRRDLVEWIGVDPERVVVVPNGVPAARCPAVDSAARLAARTPLGLNPTATVVACVGALAPEKGVDRAVHAVAALPDAHLLVVGDGPERAALEQLAERVAPGRVRFLGSVPDPLPALHAADLVVLPSRGGDAMPAVLIEAGLCGLAAVTTDVGAIPEIVLDGATGVVVAADDDAAFTAAVVRLAGDPANREAFGAAARLRCLERFELAPVARGWEAALELATTRSG